MLLYWGVKCKLCGEIIALEPAEEDIAGQITFYTPDAEPIMCRECGGSYVYGSEEVFRFKTLANPK